LTNEDRLNSEKLKMTFELDDLKASDKELFFFKRILKGKSICYDNVIHSLKNQLFVNKSKEINERALNFIHTAIC
jgi:hypothetical protein